MTKELLGEQELSIEGDFDALMEQQRARSRAGGAQAATLERAREGVERRARSRVRSPARADFQTRFTGYETERQLTTVGAVEQHDGTAVCVKLAESPFYAAGGGQVADGGHDRMRATATAARA